MCVNVYLINKKNITIYKKGKFESISKIETSLIFWFIATGDSGET